MTLDNLLSLGVQVKLTADSTVGTGGTNLFDLPCDVPCSVIFFPSLGPYRACLHTLSAKDAVTVLQSPIVGGGYFRLESTIYIFNGFNSLNLFADPYTSLA